MNGWWTLRLKPAIRAVRMAWISHTAMPLQLPKGSSSGAVVHNHHQEGRSAQVTPSPGAQMLVVGLGVG